MKKIIGISFACFFLDQLIKYVINEVISLERSVAVIENFFHLTYVRNYGAAFNILNGNRLFLILIACITLFIIYYCLMKNRVNSTLEQVGYGLFIGGILGNLWDRLIHGYVIDYLDFEIFQIHMPIFNCADICICVGVFLCVIALLKEEMGWKNSQSQKKVED
jgi:signal peptidase II